MEEIKAWARKCDGVLGVLIYGSVARGEADPYSDLDLIVVVRSPNDASAVERSLLARLDCEFNFVKDSKHVAFLKSPFLKMEFTVVPKAQLAELRHLFIESRLREPTTAILLDKSGTLSSVLSKWSSEPTNRHKDAFEREAYSFIYYYSGFHAPFARGDLYRAFFQYSLAFFKIATLTYILHGRKDYLFTPKSLMYTVGEEDANGLRAVSPVFDALKMRKGMEEMFDLFLELVKRGKMTEKFPRDVVSNLHARILDSHPRFWNLRDVGMITSIRPKVLFRTARLDRYPAEELLDWLKIMGVRTLIDLRTDQEMVERNYGYPSKVEEKLAYLHLPVTTILSSIPGPAQTNADQAMQTFYSRLQDEKSFQDAARQIFNVLANPHRFPVVIHCRGGTDRTGMIVALILLVVEVDRSEILADYLLSCGHTKPEYLQRFFESIDAKSGVETYLESIGVPRRNLLALRANLLPSVGSIA